MKFVLQFDVIVTDTATDIHVTTQSVSDVRYCMWDILSVSSIIIAYYAYICQKLIVHFSHMF